jgi:hypothetical protein
MNKNNYLSMKKIKVDKYLFLYLFYLYNYFLKNKNNKDKIYYLNYNLNFFYNVYLILIKNKINLKNFFKKIIKCYNFLINLYILLNKKLRIIKTNYFFVSKKLKIY